jgi:CRP/FNR family transcriptional regulator, anaerobic regulatory protein
MERSQNFIEKIIRLFKEFAEQKIICKGEYLVKEGQIEKNIYYVDTGALRVFRLSEFEEQTIRFGYEGSIINSLSSFIKGTPSEFYIEPIRKTSLKTISKENFLRLVNENPENLIQYNQLLESLITQQIEREIDLLTDSPTERVQRVLERSPKLFQQIPLKYIASYLRMSPETLSRIRKS